MGKRMVASDSQMRPRLHMWDGGSEGADHTLPPMTGGDRWSRPKAIVSVLRSHTFRSYRWERKPLESQFDRDPLLSLRYSLHIIIGGVSRGRGGPGQTVVRRGKMLPFLYIPLALVVPTDPMLKRFPVPSSEL